jgi:hypothetical protein
MTMAHSGGEPGDPPGIRKALEFVEGTITLAELNRWAAAFADAPHLVDPASHAVARLVRALHAAYGEQFLAPVAEGME